MKRHANRPPDLEVFCLAVGAPMPPAGTFYRIKFGPWGGVTAQIRRPRSWVGSKLIASDVILGDREVPVSDNVARACTRVLAGLSYEQRLAALHAGQRWQDYAGDFKDAA